MAETNFAVIGAEAGAMARGVTAAFTPPPANATNAFVFGFKSKASGGQAAALYYNATNYAPLRDDAANATGGSIRLAMKRGVSVTPNGYSVAIFINLQGTSVSDVGYLLGLSNDEPSSIVLAKLAPSSGLDIDSTNILRTSSATYTQDTWVQLRLDSIVNPNGDVVLKCFQNDLDNYKVDDPTWESISGMDDYIDDALAINSGSDPLAGGYMGFCCYSSILNGVALVDHLECYRQK